MNRSKFTDDQLLKMIAGGGSARENAMKFLFENQALRNKVNYMVRNNGGNAQDAEDVCQESLILLDKKIRNGAFRGESSLSTFMVGMARNLWRNQFRKSKRVELYEQPLKEGGAQDVSPEDLMMQKEEKQNIELLLGLLGARCRKILELWRLSHSMEEIAEVMGLSSAAMAKKSKYRCLKTLKESLAKMDTTFLR